MPRTVRWIRRPAVWVPVLLFLLFVVLRLSLNPIARYFTSRALNSSQQLSGTFSDLGVSLPHLTYWIEDLTIRERGPSATKEPLCYTKRFFIGLSARNLFHRRLVAHINVYRPSSLLLLRQLKARLADAGLRIFSDRVPGCNALATLIPISGPVSRPATELWPTLVSAFRNAFVEGIAEGIAYLPPPRAASAEVKGEKGSKDRENDKGRPQGRRRAQPSVRQQR